jgi:hypothetical protein
LGAPSDIAGVAALLATLDARCLTGQINGAIKPGETARSVISQAVSRTGSPGRHR